MAKLSLGKSIQNEIPLAIAPSTFDVTTDYIPEIPDPIGEYITYISYRGTIILLYGDILLIMMMMQDG